jgi:hypothetical protein
VITVQFDPREIDQKQNWEESDHIVAATLSHETEQMLLERARGIREQLMSMPLHGDEETMRRVPLETSFLRGQYDLLLGLVAASKEAKVAAHLI